VRDPLAIGQKSQWLTAKAASPQEPKRREILAMGKGVSREGESEEAHLKLNVLGEPQNEPYPFFYKGLTSANAG
jgi:hypothetical protein